jgi:hypothetical protein
VCFSLLIAVSCILVSSADACASEGSRTVLDQLVADSRRHITIMESAALQNLKLQPADAQALASYAQSHSDETAYHVLVALRRADGPEYQQIPARTRAAILCGALATQVYLNDWGYLDPNEPYDGEAARLLLEQGDAAKPCLIRLLDDTRPAPLFGSEEATMSRTFQYRRRDFAYRYLSQILGMKPVFDPDPTRRDAEIAQLKKRIPPALI